MLTVVAENGSTREGVSLLDDVVREGVRRMLAAALEAEVDAYSAGAIEVKAPRVNDKRTDPDTGERRRFASAILPVVLQYPRTGP